MRKGVGRLVSFGEMRMPRQKRVPAEKIICSTCGMPFHGLTECGVNRNVIERLFEVSLKTMRAHDVALGDLERALGCEIDGEILDTYDVEDLVGMAQKAAAKQTVSA